VGVEKDRASVEYWQHNAANRAFSAHFVKKKAACGLFWEVVAVGECCRGRGGFWGFWPKQLVFIVPSGWFDRLGVVMNWQW
jgi:hypothetical protein